MKQMRTHRTLGVLTLLCGLLWATATHAQGIPTADLTGRVSDADHRAIPGVTVTVSSPALQGERTATTDQNGVYLLRGLPAGDYTVTYAADNFETQTRARRLSAAQNVVLDVDMSLAQVADVVTVTGQPVTDLSRGTTTSTTIAQQTLEALPIGRTQLNAVSLTAGTADTGPRAAGGNAFVISGAQSWENSYQVNGVDVTDNVRHTPYTLFIEDAIEETTTSTAGVSAEFGRFAGGVINTVTKSGGNDFHGSLRDNLQNDSWAGKNQFSPDVKDKINPTYEGTLGGRLVKDKLWFFAAGRALKTENTATTNILNIPWTPTRDQKRYEGKLTFSPTPSHRLTGSYIKIDDTAVTAEGGLTQYQIDLSGLDNRSTPQDLLAFNYSGVLTPNLYVEGQYSERKFNFEPEGGTDPSIAGGTPIYDLTNGVIYNESLFCGICPDGADHRDNKEALAKLSYFLSTESLGSHDLVFGVDRFDDIRNANNYQSTTNFILNVDDSLFINGAAYPVVINNDEGGGTYFSYYPILATSKGTSFKTNSVFVNDRWRLNDRWSFNVGLRYDANDGSDEEGKKVVSDSAISPRLGLTWNPDTAGKWVVNASAGRYVAAIANTIADASSAAGGPASFFYGYQGPNFNTPGQPLLSTEDVVGQVFNWFNANGGIHNNDLLLASVIPGGDTIIGNNLRSTSADEYTVGFVRNFGSRGSIRTDLIHREFGNFYFTRQDQTTGQVVNASGQTTDLAVIGNDDSHYNRQYDGLQTSFNFRLNDALTLGGNYTLSRAYGNLEGENSGSGPLTFDAGSSLGSYPEYRQTRWNAPDGDLLVDQRHKVRLWAIWDAVSTDRHKLTVSLLESYFSGQPYSAVGSIDPSPYVADQGYALPPTAVNYFFSKRGAFHEPDITQTDLAVNYSLSLGRFEIFVQPQIRNLFNEDGVILLNPASQPVLTSKSDLSLQPFNPFTETPVEGVNYRLGNNFGKATSVNDLQVVRTFLISAGIRF